MSEFRDLKRFVYEIGFIHIAKRILFVSPTIAAFQFVVQRYFFNYEFFYLTLHRQPGLFTPRAKFHSSIFPRQFLFSILEKLLMLRIRRQI